ncbi:MAG: isoprenylcysteine carboxylmethyltransferase family protein [Deltaproteobacteria bacterium]|nr:isoprenylcysteine carboxylmethyltransferase family protein [Deltaproteobacteria bacterium]
MVSKESEQGIVTTSNNAQSEAYAGVRHPPHPPDASPVVIWLRRYRRYLPIPLVLLTLLWLQPTVPFGSPLLDTVSDIFGVAICALGQWLRMWAWGSNASVGKWGVRDRGPYQLMRHPLYAGNFLIVAGLVIVFHNPWAYPLLLLPFAYLYHSITTMEEQRLRRRFSNDYQEYRKDAVPRFLPALGNLQAAFATTRPFGWGLAWRKEYESCCGWFAGVMLLQVYEGVVARGWTANWQYSIRWFIALGIIGLLALVLRIRKQTTPRSSTH